jgi:hypothetical protein
MRRAQTVFWIVYLLFPIFTGLLAYDWLPNESYDERRHKLLTSHDVCDNNRNVCEDHPDAWADKRTGAVFTSARFDEHRKSEAVRMAYADAFYALIGCFMFAYLNATHGDVSFRRNLKQAFCVAAAIVGYLFLMMYFPR